MSNNDFNFDNYFKKHPSNEGFFGKYDAVDVSDELKQAMKEITDAYFTICKSSKFISELRRIRKEFQGRPTPISHLERLSNKIGNVQIYVKREDLNHTGAHKLNHCMGEALLAKYMGKKKVIAETGAGHHPFPMMVRGFQSVVGIEAREQFYNMTGELPDAIVACVGGGQIQLASSLAF